MSIANLTPDVAAGSWLAGLQDGIVPAAEAVARLLPSAQQLVPGAPVSAAEVDPSGWPTGALATFTGMPGASVGVLVGADLAGALASAPSGGLDVGAAVQPALDAAAQALDVSAGAASTLTGAPLASALAAATVAVPLLDGAETVAVLFVTAAADGTATARSASGPRAVRSLSNRGVELLHGVDMEVTVELGRTRLSVRELLALAPGDVLELDRAAGSPADLLVNGRLIARGEVVVVDEDFALRVTEIVAQPQAS